MIKNNKIKGTYLEQERELGIRELPCQWFVKLQSKKLQFYQYLNDIWFVMILSELE
jgi:hypothetical protein